MPLRLLTPLQAALAPLEHKALLPAERRLAAPNHHARTYALAHHLARPVLHNGYWLVKLTAAGRARLDHQPSYQYTNPNDPAKMAALYRNRQ